GVERGGKHVLHGATRREGGILRHVPDANAATPRASPAIGRLEAGEDLEEGGLAGAVRTHKAHLVPLEEPEGQPLEEGPGAVGLADCFTAQEQRSGHATLLLLLLRLFLFLLHVLSLGHVLTPLPVCARCGFRHPIICGIAPSGILREVEPRPHPLTRRSPMGARAESLAKKYEAKAAELTATIQKLSDADWKKVTPAQNWPGGVTAHHVA